MKSVCVVGAGPAGIVTAKSLLQEGNFSVTIYEKGQGLGGLWAVDNESHHSSPHNFLGANTPTNLSKFTVGFSDLSWESVDLSIWDKHGASQENRRAPMFPKAWMVGKYLEAYRKKYLPDGIIHYQNDVRAASRIIDDKRKVRWHVTVRSQAGQERTETFDYLIAASGFFSQPRALKSGSWGESAQTIPTIHSSQYRRLSDLCDEGGQKKVKNIAVVGGGNSAGETAATVASQLSSKRWSPEVVDRELYAECKIYHVMPRSLYSLPPYNIADATATTYMPLDLKLYDLSRRPSVPITANAGCIPSAVKDTIHGAIQGMIGSDQSDLGSDVLVSKAGSQRATSYVALSESYAEYVRNGTIIPVAGRPSRLEQTNNHFAYITVEDGEASTKIQDVSAIIECTGYTPATALSYLPADLKKLLSFDAESARLPLILENWQTGGSQVPDLAFIGFYEGPYWGIMEQQARLVADRWSNNPSPTQRPYESRESLLKLREAMRNRGLDVPQYWFGDYVGYMEEIASALGLQRNDGAFDERTGCVTAARYLAPGDNKTEADKTMQDLYTTWQACLQGRYVPRAALRALHGKWQLNRTITSANASYPSGTFTGEATFHHRAPTANTFDLEYLYIESGEFRSSNANFPAMTASRRYVYRYAEATDQLSVWFVKPDQNLEVDYLFHDLAFVPPEVARSAGCLMAKADHLCVEDMYWTEYRLPMRGIALPRFEVKHTVKGPPGGKDYVMDSKYERPPMR